MWQWVLYFGNIEFWACGLHGQDDAVGLKIAHGYPHRDAAPTALGIPALHRTDMLLRQ